MILSRIEHVNGNPPGELLARGRTADVYTWQAGTVLKLFHHPIPKESVDSEARIARTALALGLQVPAVGDVIQFKGRWGLVLERMSGFTMLESLQRQPWHIVRYARRLAALHIQLHAREFGPEMPSQRQRLESKIRQASVLHAAQQSTALSALQDMPDGNRICHGDFHPGNILLTTRGEVVIDWMDGARGNPLADLARSTIIAMGAIACNQIDSPFLKMLIRVFHAVYLRRYFSLCPGGEREYRRWLPIVAAARLSENIPELETWLVAEAQKVG